MLWEHLGPDRYRIPRLHETVLCANIGVAVIVYVVLVTFARGANVDNVYQDYIQAWDRVDELRNNGFEATVRGRDIIANVWHVGETSHVQ